MAEEPQPPAISAAYPAPPPFYKSFTSQNLERRKEYLGSLPPQAPDRSPTSGTSPDILSLPPELRNLIPPSPPSNGQYRSFGTLHSLNPASAEPNIIPTPSRLTELTENLLITFLSLTNALATNPGAYGPLWDQLHEGFQEVHKVINRYRPHQARELLILMMEEQIEKVKAETEAVRESVTRARDMIEGLGIGNETLSKHIGTDNAVRGSTIDQTRMHKRLWGILETNVGRP